MRKVLVSTTSHPIALMASSAATGLAAVTVQIGCGSGRHCQNNSTRASEASTTYVERSMGAGTILVHQALNAGRAIRLCWTANRPSKAASIAKVGISAPGVPLLMFLGTTQLSTKPIAYRNAPKKVA